MACLASQPVEATLFSIKLSARPVWEVMGDWPEKQREIVLLTVMFYIPVNVL